MLDGLQSSDITVSALGYISAKQSISIEDAESLMLAIDVTSIDERAGRALGTVTRSNTDTNSPLVVSLSSTSSSRINLPASVEILAGQSSATFEVLGINDNLLNTSSLIQIQATSPSYLGATAEITVQDDEALTPWRNPRNSLDVDNSGQVVPLDALLVINSLNTEGPRKLPASLPDPFEPVRYLDCNGDGSLSAIDALLVINFLNTRVSGEGESINASAATDLALVSLDNDVVNPHARRGRRI